MCVASKRVYIHRDIYQQFRDRLVEEVKSIASNQSPEALNVYGPMQNEMQCTAVQDIMEDCRARGYVFSLGREPGVSQGNLLLLPAVIDNPPDNSRIVKEEQFGQFQPGPPSALTWIRTEFKRP